MDIEVDMKNLSVKVLQHGKCGLIRFVMESLISKQVQHIPNEDVERINLPKEKLLTKEVIYRKKLRIAMHTYSN